jgi:tRNA N6-adenosine threonylcarbamoyltransferase
MTYASSPNPTPEQEPSAGRATLTLGVETSCDETAAAVVEGTSRIRSSVVGGQVDVHRAFGGVVPELASRAHLELLTPVLEQALEESGVIRGTENRCLDAVCATVGPGLVGSLLVGLSEAKALALAWAVPFAGVNHLEGHLFAALLDHPDPPWPLVVLLVSGGHTMLVSMEGLGRYRLLGQTVDDAAGEAFDKVARFLGLGHPGGPAIEREASSGDPELFSFPRAMLADGLDFSFSGLKTAVVYAVRGSPDASNADVAASFQQAVVDVLVKKAVRGAEAVAAAGICLAGGVAANGPLRKGFEQAGEALGIPVFLPSRAMCTDNAAMIAAAGRWQLDHVGPSPLDLAVQPSLGLPLAG